MSDDIFVNDDLIYGELIVLAARKLYPDWWLSKLKVRRETEIYVTARVTSDK